MDLTAAHWMYLAGVVVIIGVMITRKNVVVPAVAATFFTAWLFTGSFADDHSSRVGRTITPNADRFRMAPKSTITTFRVSIHIWYH